MILSFGFSNYNVVVPFPKLGKSVREVSAMKSSILAM